MKPYAQANGVVVYHGDCREVLPSLGRDSIDLIVTDPPYGVDWQSGRRGIAFDRIAGDDGSLDIAACLRMAIASLRNHRHVYVFGLADWGDLPIGGRTELIWDKGMMGSGNLALPWGLAHEKIAFGFHTRQKANPASDGGLSARLRRGTVLRVDRVNAAAVTRHPTEKPPELLRMLIESSSLLGETVLDPFAGVGSTGVAAILEGRKAILIELEERYCETAARRIAATQPALVAI